MAGATLGLALKRSKAGSDPFLLNAPHSLLKLPLPTPDAILDYIRFGPTGRPSTRGK